MSATHLLLIDGTALAYRAFYAIPALNTTDGRPSNAIFGFIRLLRQLEQVWQPGGMAVVFDGGKPEARMQAWPAYKEGRAPMPDALQAQLPAIEDYLDRAGIASIRLLGEEADDILASLAVRAEEVGRDVLLATADKDFYQVVTEHIHLVSLTRSGERVGPAEVEARAGVPPSLAVAWQALIGDTVDNIPGVPGVGGKTAARLLARYGSLEEIWRCLPEVTPEKIRRSLADHRADVERNVKLMTLRRDLDGGVDTARLAMNKPEPARLLPFFENWELHSFARSLREPGLPGLPEEPSVS